MVLVIRKKDYKKVETELRDHLVERFDDVTVRIGDGIHYKGTNVVVTTAAFAGLLPEQRYHHVVHAMPVAFYEEHLRGGVVWFELAPGETGLAYMKMPRSEDIVAEVPAICRRLEEVGFFDKLRSTLAPDLADASQHDFVAVRQVLADLGWSDAESVKARLFFIHHGGFCDLEILTVVVPSLNGDDATPSSAGRD